MNTAPRFLPRLPTWTTALFVAGLGAGCLQMDAPFTEPVVLAGAPVAPEVLNKGREDYITFCMQCHGRLGDGQGHAAPGLWPPPRDFQAAQFKFTAVEQGELPTDDELVRLVRSGLGGTAMRQWDISDERLRGIIQYIKVLARDEWEGDDVEPGELIEMSENPYGPGDRDTAIALGEQVYHAYGCYTCHPAYVRPERIGAAVAAILGSSVSPSLRANWHRTELKASQYSAKVLPPDFTWHPIRTVRPEWPRDEQVRQYYRIIAAGINGAAMPAWQGIMPEDQIWALSTYLQSLAALRDTPERTEFWARIGVDPVADQPAYPPPATADAG